MRELGFKNIVTDMQSKKTWTEIAVPDLLQNRLNDLKMDKPSNIQASAIPKIMKEPHENLLFQAINGSGKTLAFGVPSIMKADPEVKAIQVIIIANTRELIRQVQQVLTVLTKDMGVEVCVGDKDTPEQPQQQILVTVPKWLEKRVTGRKKMNLSNLKMMVYDEADEIYL